MTKVELYELIKLPEGAIEQLNQYESNRREDIPAGIKEKLFARESWGEGVKELQEYLGEDPYHINVLWEQLNFGRSAYRLYFSCCAVYFLYAASCPSSSQGS